MLQYKSVTYTEACSTYVPQRSFKNEYVHIEGVKPAIESTASCIAYFGKVIIESSKESLSTLMTNIEGARSIQSRCLSDIRNVESLPILRDLGGILTDLSRILRELEEAALALTKKQRLKMTSITVSSSQRID
ncbi:hypothetical protein GCM10020331_061450 [Ectobacillus funiculus]